MKQIFLKEAKKMLEKRKKEGKGKNKFHEKVDLTSKH